MSVKVMAWVFENGPHDTSERLVLLALADYAADNGEWSPSMIGIAEKAGMTERGARGVVRRLEAGGWISVDVGGGRGGRSRYRVLMGRNPERHSGFQGDKNPECQTRNVKPGMSNPEYRSGFSGRNPEHGDTKPGTSVPPNRQEPSLPDTDVSGRDASISLPADDPPEDFAKQMFDRGVVYLKRHGVREAQARSFIGKLRKNGSTDAEIFEAFSACSRAGTVDPIPWIAAKLKPPEYQNPITDNVIRMVEEQFFRSAK